VPIGATLAVEGSEAASAQYRHLQNTQPDRYDFRPSRFLDATWGAIEVHRAEVVLPLVQLWVTLQPDSSQAYELLGWAYLVQAATEVATNHLRRALALDPENEHAEQLLQQLSR
jgi:tetratricopeptide (TPR) repeat protein